MKQITDPQELDEIDELIESHDCLEDVLDKLLDIAVDEVLEEYEQGEV